MKYSITIKLILAVLLLFAGGVIYIAFRTESLAMFTWFRALHLNGWIEWMREKASGVELPYFIKYCLPNGLWITSYILAADALVESNKLLWVLALSSIAILFEILQIMGIIPGTFDIGDLFCLIIPSLLYIIYFVYRYEKNA